MNESNKSTIKNIIAVLVLLFIPLVGLIIMWFLASWRRGVKWFITILYTIILIIPIGSTIFVTFLSSKHQSITVPSAVTNIPGVKSQVSDVQRISTIQKLAASIHDYCVANNGCPVTLNDLVPKYISTVPVDPASNQPFNYQRLSSNIMDYEISITLSSGKRFVTSMRGSQTL